jgi:mannose-6-phosphate isomerase-like protein (cupin superfamily)
MRAIDRNTAEHYLWAEICDGWHLVQHDDLSVIAERAPAGAAETRHAHRRARQFFYVLSGSAVVELGSERVVLTVGQGLEIPPGVAHRFKNESAQDVEFLVISQPTARGDRSEVG